MKQLNIDEALTDLTTLTEFGPRFHGSIGIHQAADWLEARVRTLGLDVTRQMVSLGSWEPGRTNTLRTVTPIERDFPVWPMLWSGSSNGRVCGTLDSLGPGGIWGDSITWQRFVVRDGDGNVAAYVHSRDTGPAAPQPLPHGSDVSVPHLVVSRTDGIQLNEWLGQEIEVRVEIEGSSEPLETQAVADNLIVDLPGRRPDTVLICAHYDSFYNTVGAYDNGSGTIALLKLLERLAGTTLERSIRIVWFTAEEWHLAGSRHYVNEQSQDELDRLDFVVNIDGLGRGDFLESFSSPEEFGVVCNDTIFRYAKESGRTLHSTNRFPPTTGTDDASFYRAGVPSIFVTFNDLSRLHQPDDLPNPGIASNIVWSQGLIDDFLMLERPRRVGRPGIL